MTDLRDADQMSPDQQQPPESEKDETQTPPTPVTAAETGDSEQWLETTSETVESTVTTKLPFLKAQTVKVLRGTIGLLEGVVEKLETEPVRELPSRRLEPESLSSTKEPVVTVPVSDTPQVAPVPAAEELEQKSAKPPHKAKGIDRLLPSFKALQAFWNGILDKVRLLLPAAWNQKLSDWALTGAITTVVVAVLLTTVALLPETPSQIAKAPPPTETIEAPPELEAPTAPQPVEPELPSPPPPLVLTPEQSLVAAVQNQVAEITAQYGEGLIQSIQANFLTSLITVKVGDGWYELEESEQNDLADSILLRSQELDFSKLEVTDLQGNLIARSPVVGPHMVIFRRQELAANL
ncbi:hypothetical protein [Lyngbya aestuarii]|uniref:hypothetical protein n=1 Tax=Lyngbya aestuarii TaxID=118322 RepID=UPI00403E0225